MAYFDGEKEPLTSCNAGNSTPWPLASGTEVPPAQAYAAGPGRRGVTPRRSARGAKGEQSPGKQAICLSCVAALPGAGVAGRAHRRPAGYRRSARRAARPGHAGACQPREDMIIVQFTCELLRAIPVARSASREAPLTFPAAQCHPADRRNCRVTRNIQAGLHPARRDQALEVPSAVGRGASPSQYPPRHIYILLEPAR
jgi:hypothetical protein